MAEVPDRQFNEIRSDADDALRQFYNALRTGQSDQVDHHRQALLNEIDSLLESGKLIFGYK